jgi:hypothetical protein
MPSKPIGCPWLTDRSSFCSSGTQVKLYVLDHMASVSTGTAGRQKPFLAQKNEGYVIGK